MHVGPTWVKGFKCGWKVIAPIITWEDNHVLLRESKVMELLGERCDVGCGGRNVLVCSVIAGCQAVFPPHLHLPRGPTWLLHVRIQSKCQPSLFGHFYVKFTQCLKTSANNCYNEYEDNTRKTESRAATASISAHDTVSGQAISSSDLIESITSNPLNEFKLGAAVFSPVKLGVSSNNTEASHPFQ